MTYTEILKYIKINSIRFSKEKLIDGMPEATSASLAIVAKLFSMEILEVINDYADIK